MHMTTTVGDVAAPASIDFALVDDDVAPSVCVCVFVRACVCACICVEVTTSTEAPIVVAAAIHKKLVTLEVAVVSF